MGIIKNNKREESVKIICLTPVKNEKWILQKFLQSASLWADHIIIVDQMSDDGSREIAKKFLKVDLVDNYSLVFNELDRQKILIAEARKIPGKKIFIALDADEILSGNFAENFDWKEIKNLAEGTSIYFKFVNLLPSKGKYWEGPSEMPWGFVDDGSDHNGLIIHSNRLPLSAKGTSFKMDNTVVLHYQFADWKRMESKHRWYQCWEHINDPKKSSIAIYRQYHHMHSIEEDDLKSIPREWFLEYEKNKIYLENFEGKESYHWDYEVINYLKYHGPEYFSRLDIWGKDWQKLTNNIENNGAINLSPKQNIFDKLVLFYLQKTQRYYSEKNILILLIDKMFKIFLK